jgi:putative membrane protein insertion efficiency factor
VSDWLLAFYKRGISPLLHGALGITGACRFQPTCSEYAAIAFKAHGPLVGGALAVWRLLRCNPLTRGGFDPVPGTWPPSRADQHPSGRAPVAPPPSRKRAVHLP